MVVWPGLIEDELCDGLGLGGIEGRGLIQGEISLGPRVGEMGGGLFGSSRCE